MYSEFARYHMLYVAWHCMFFVVFSMNILSVLKETNRFIAKRIYFVEELQSANIR